jgi:hypothetical protein
MARPVKFPNIANVMATTVESRAPAIRKRLLAVDGVQGADLRVAGRAKKYITVKVAVLTDGEWKLYRHRLATTLPKKVTLETLVDTLDARLAVFEAQIEKAAGGAIANG